MVRNIKLTIEYDGTDFYGWQVQPGMRTVQGVLEEKLRTLLRRPVNLIGAGRTDAGVHALGQVANFHTDSPLDTESLWRGLNSLLPHDVVVHQVVEVPQGFHARFDAKARRYCYRIALRPRAIGRQYVWMVRYSLDLSKVEAASEPLLGRHDFTSFSTSDPEVKSFDCTVTELKWREEGEELVLDIEADRFLQAMVRTIVGTLVEVGRGKLPVDYVGYILEAKDRKLAGPTAPARGLCLMEVKY